MKLVAVTSCITGIAHTYMAAEALEQAAKKAGHELSVETQGSAGSSPLPAKVLAEAQAAIFAVDLEVKNRGRFDHLPFVQVAVAKALHNADALAAEAVAKATAAAEAGGASASTTTEDAAAAGPAEAAPVAGAAATPAAESPASAKKTGFLGRLFGS